MALREGCKRALWFTDSFNMDLLRVVFQSRKTGEPINIVYDEGAYICINNTPDSNQLLLYQILYLLDKFAISDEFYHELCMLSPCLPRCYKVKAVRASINQSIKLEHLPKPYFGCYRSLYDCIVETIEIEVSRLHVHVYMGLIKPSLHESLKAISIYHL